MSIFSCLLDKVFDFFFVLCGKESYFWGKDRMKEGKERIKRKMMKYHLRVESEKWYVFPKNSNLL